LLNQILCLASTLGVSKLIIVKDMILVAVVVIFKPDFDVQQTHLRTLLKATVDQIFSSRFIDLLRRDLVSFLCSVPCLLNLGVFD